MLSAENPTRRQAVVSTALAALVACAVLLPLLGHKPLTEWDEGIYAEVSREMLGGSWWAPHWNYQVWLEKPPLMLWVTAAFFKLFGVSEFWARAGSALSGVGIVALLHGWLVRRHGLLTAWLSSVILLATLGFLHVCHVGEMDVLLALGACVALVGLTQVEDEQSQGWYWFWLGFAIALMTKGAASVVIPVTTVVFAVTQRWGWRRFGAAFWIGMAVFAALVLPWHLAMYQGFGHAFVDQYLGLHVLARATQQIEGHNTPWWFYLKVLVVSAPPFCLLYPVAAGRGYRQPALRVWAIFAVVVLLFFSVIQTRLPHYIAPAYPALALLTAVWAGDWIRPRLTRETAFWVRTGLGVAAVWALSIALTHTALKNLHSARLGDGANGSVLADNKETDALLKAADVAEAPPGGPLLLWREPRIQSIATVVFYAQRQVQQVTLEAPGPGEPLDQYKYAPVLLRQAVGCEARLILLDKSLIPQIPRTMQYKPVRSSETLELGTIVCRPQ
jgi:4-amino-4-deoxy-L-arabinose transferase-like glycosyltransferase